MRILMAYTGGFTPEMYAEFEKLGLEPVFLPGENGKPGSELQTYDMDFSDIDAVMCYLFFSYNDISRFPSLKYIHTTSAGLDHMPMDYIQSHGIRLCNARGVYSAPMAEFALCGVLQLYKDAPRFRDRQKAHVWHRSWNLRELTDKQVCIIGPGSIGTECAKRFSAMGCRCIGACRHPDPTAEYYVDQVHTDLLPEVLPQTDILILCLPLNEGTRGFMSQERIAMLKPGAILVNIARGPIVDTPALLDALQRKALSGAVIDVFDEEPLAADSPFWDMDNVLVTPHNSFAAEYNHLRMFDLVYKDTVNWLKEVRK